MRKYVAAVILLGFCLSGCTTWKLEELRSTTPKGNAFQAELARQYLAFSESEAKQYDWLDSQYFADKGLRAAYGQDVPPETPADWDIPSENRQELDQGYQALSAALTPDVKQGNPELAARAQSSFDCWLEQQEENWQTEDIAACRGAFQAAMQELTGGVPQPLIRSTAYIVFFEFDSAVLTPEGKQVIGQVLYDLADSVPAEILLQGHADRAGTDKYNMELSERRALAVRAELLAGGVPEEKINYLAFGETDPRKQTPDGIAEPVNRRVEIFLE